MATKTKPDLTIKFYSEIQTTHSAPTVLAFDPGASGGYAKGIGLPGEEASASKMPDNDADIVDVIRSEHIASNGHLVVFIEQVPKFCGKALPAASIAGLFGNYKFLVGVCAGLGVRYHLVTPQAWQGVVHAGTKGGRTTDQWKRHLRDIATRIYPTLKPSLATADALLLLEYGRQYLVGNLHKK